MNYVVRFLRPPRFAADLKVIQIDVNPTELGHNRPADVPIVGDARAVLEQLVAAGRGAIDPARYQAWTGRLRVLDAEKQAEMDKAMSADQTPIHPLRLCKEVRDFLGRDAILVVDGQEILNFGRQSIPTFAPGHRLNSGPFGCMGVGLPFGVGRQGGARPTSRWWCSTATAPSASTRWRSTPPCATACRCCGHQPTTAAGRRIRRAPSRAADLGFTRYDRMAEAFGAHGEFVEQAPRHPPRPRARAASGEPAVVNVITDFKARSTTVRFSAYTT